VFFINVPIGVLTILGLMTYLVDSPRNAKAGFDWTGFLLLALAIGGLQMMLDRGENLDWFSSTEIMIEAGLAVIAFYMFIVHMLTSDNPFIDPKIFADRNFSIGLIAIFIVGIILLATMALLTPFLQQVLDYPVLTAGLVMAPRGIGTMIAMMIVGRLITRIDPRFMFAFGLSLIALTLWEMTYFTTDVSQATIIRTGITQGAGLGFVFVPLSTVTFATLAPRYRTQATSLFSLMRNIGSSIGISIVIFLLTRNTAVMHADLTSHVTPFNLGLHMPGSERIWDMTTLAGKAALNGEVTKQASVIAYANDYLLMMYVALASLPLALLLSKPGKAPAAGAPAAAAVAD
jgi:DHA2 family multidrug resistance protein